MVKTISKENIKLHKPSFEKDIVITLIVKLMALGLIWALCFSHPTDKKIDMNAMNQHLLSL
jgi:hypothetical protein